MTWLIGGVFVSAIVALLGFSRSRNRDAEMGSVSGQWLAENRHDRHL
jgi:hypothetical protein